MDLVQPYIAIALKLVTGMIGILVFLRIAGKAQMAQITPLDTVSAFVIGALVGGILKRNIKQKSTFDGYIRQCRFLFFVQLRLKIGRKRLYTIYHNRRYGILYYLESISD